MTIYITLALNDIVYQQWSCHSDHRLLCKLRRNLGPHCLENRPCGPDGWLALLLIKACDIETNPGLTTTHKEVWIFDICPKQIHDRNQISIRCNRIGHWVHLRCAGIRLAQYTDAWICHLHRKFRLTITQT